MLRHRLLGHSKAVLGVAASPDGCLAYSASHDMHIRVWDTVRGSCLHVLKVGVGCCPQGMCGAGHMAEGVECRVRSEGCGTAIICRRGVQGVGCRV